jgi:hypothetical protein
MPTLILHTLPSHNAWAANTLLAAGSGSGAAPGGVGLLGLLVAAILLALALRHLVRAFLPIAELLRMIAAAGLVAVLILAAFVLILISAFYRG